MGQDFRAKTSDATASEARPVQNEYEWDRVPPSKAIVESIAESLDRDVLDFEPVYYSMELDAVDAMFRRSDVSAKTLTFDYRGLSVTLDDSGDLRVEPKEESR